MNTTLNLLRLALANAWRHRTKTVLVAAVVALANAALVVQLAQGSGQARAFRDGMIGALSGHLQFHADGAETDVLEGADPGAARIDQVAALDALLADEPTVTAVAHRVRFGAMIARDDESWGGLILGVEPEAERQVCDRIELAEGRFVAPGANEVVISAKVATDRGLALGDALVFLTSTVGEYVNATELEIVGLLRADGLSGFYEHLAYMPIGPARHLLGLPIDASDEIVARLARVEDTATTATVLRARLAQSALAVKVTRWDETGKMFRGILAIGTGFRILAGVFLGTVALFLVFNTLSVYVFERGAEIATMLALGYRRASIALLFAAEGLFVILVASVAGLTLGGGLSLWLGRVGIPAFNEAMRYVFAGDRLYPILEPRHVALLLAGSSVVALLAALLPSLRAANLDPSRALNGEMA